MLSCINAYLNIHLKLKFLKHQNPIDMNYVPSFFPAASTLSAGTEPAVFKLSEVVLFDSVTSVSSTVLGFCLPSSSDSVMMSISQPVKRDASLTFCPFLPIAKES